MKLKKIHSDDRRSIDLIDGLLEDGKEFTIIDLKKGKAIGGCLHSAPEHLCVVSGQIWVKIGNNLDTISEGQSSYIPSGYPHMFVGITDAKIIEWGVNADDKNRKDNKMREEVDMINDGEDLS